VTADLEALQAGVIRMAEVECTGHIKAFVDARIDVAARRIDVRWKGSPPASIINLLEATPPWVRVRVRRLEWTPRELEAGSDIWWSESQPQELAAQINEIVPTIRTLQRGGAGLLLGYNSESEDAIEDARISAALTAIVGIPVWARRTEEEDDPMLARSER